MYTSCIHALKRLRIRTSHHHSCHVNVESTFVLDLQTGPTLLQCKHFNSESNWLVSLYMSKQALLYIITHVITCWYNVFILQTKNACIAFSYNQFCYPTLLWTMLTLIMLIPSYIQSILHTSDTLGAFHLIREFVIYYWYSGWNEDHVSAICCIAYEY
jgi:hypothetical protein